MDFVVSEGVQAIFLTWLILQGVSYLVVSFSTDLTYFGD